MEKNIIEKVEKQVKEELKGKINEDAIGYIHVFEQRKKELLKEYGIEWKMTSETSFGKSID